ncbi:MULTISPECIES: hypothetical protein [Streptomyces]|uniref:Uncharacterized protein n=1 Tax=Streptomyces lonegramiae TaxID=3075524 RepID=A0ABU2XXN4_9ACTN|nr:hypothetical protein [Streptomyces sp. DSM 41529]MDT0550247.1 hypothetical protein [Streptomyces sp. DSM 41529]
MNPRESLLELINVFLSGQDRSMQVVSRIEAVAIDYFLDSDVYEILSEPLSLYRPGEGLPYVNEEEMAEALEEARRALVDNTDGDE